MSRIHEIYHWPTTTKFDPKTHEGGLFSKYVNTFLKLKQQASGWPDRCKKKNQNGEVVLDETECEKYVQDYFEHEQIRLEPGKIEFNPGLRTISKLALNSLWGKLGQRPNLVRSTLVRTARDFFKIFMDQSVHIVDWHLLTEDVAKVDYQMKHEFQKDNPQANVFLAALTASYGRLRLYTELEKLGDRVVYNDTDSVVYISRPGQYDIPLGEYLGEFTCELGPSQSGDPRWVEIFVTAGLKNYSTQNSDKTHMCKVKGFSLTHENAQRINFQSMKREVELFMKNETQNLYTENRSKFKIRDGVIHTTTERKHYSVVIDKRVVQSNYFTQPYGY